jgi:nucleoside-diphosphate-sugar epimerase
VNWVKGNATNAELARNLAQESDVVVHAAGVLFQTPEFSQVINSPTIGTTISAFGAAVAAGWSQFRQAYSNRELQDFEGVQCSSAINLASGIKPGKTVIYTSAAISPMMKYFVHPQYISSKQRAESEILQNQAIRGLIFRPGLIQSESRPMAYLLGLGSIMLEKVGLLPPKIHVKKLASAIVYAAENSSENGVFEYPEIIMISNLSNSTLK